MTVVVLSRRLVLEQPVAAPDGAGGYARSWEPLGTLWAEVVATSGRERDGGTVSLSSSQFRITVRGAPEGQEARPKPEQRFREGTRLYQIEAVSVRDPQGRYLICRASEEQAT